MKKGLLLITILLAVVLFAGCEEIKNPTLTGIKTQENGDTEEIIYEWDYNEPTKVIKVTKIFTYKSSTNSMYNMKAIDCEGFKKQSSLFDCRVEKKNGNVVYKEFYYKDEIKTEEEAREDILKEGYKIN